MIDYKSEPFTLVFGENYLSKGDTLYLSETVKARVLEKPYKIWYKKLFQFISFGIYSAPYQYKVEIVN